MVSKSYENSKLALRLFDHMSRQSRISKSGPSVESDLTARSSPEEIVARKKIEDNVEYLRSLNENSLVNPRSSDYPALYSFLNSIADFLRTDKIVDSRDIPRPLGDDKHYRITLDYLSKRIVDRIRKRDLGEKELTATKYLVVVYWIISHMSMVERAEGEDVVPRVRRHQISGINMVRSSQLFTGAMMAMNGISETNRGTDAFSLVAGNPKSSVTRSRVGNHSSDIGHVDREPVYIAPARLTRSHDSSAIPKSRCFVPRTRDMADILYRCINGTDDIAKDFEHIKRVVTRYGDDRKGDRRIGLSRDRGIKMIVISEYCKFWSRLWGQNISKLRMNGNKDNRNKSRELKILQRQSGLFHIAQTILALS